MFPTATLEPNGTGYDPDRSPLSPLNYLPTLEQARAIRELEEKFKLAEEARRPQEESWLECVAFEANKQWHRYNWNAGILELPKAPPWRIRATHNLIKPKVQQITSALVQDIPLLEVEPMSPQQRDQVKARTGRELLQYLHERLRWDRLYASLAKWASITGCSFVKGFWDPSQQDTQAVPLTYPGTTEPVLDPTTGEPIIVGSRRHIGQVATQFCSPFELYPEPGSQSFPAAEWCFHAKVRSLKYIRDTYPEFGPFVSGEVGSQSPGYIERRVSDIMDGGSGQASPQHQDKSAVLLEYWEKPCPRYPEGRCITLCNGVLLRQRALPYPHLVERRLLPFTQFPYDPSDLSPWPRGLVEYLVPLQKAYNRALSDILGMLKMTGMPKILWPLECGAGTSGPTSEPGQLIKYLASAGGGAKPEYWTPPNIQAAWFELLQVIKADFEDVSNRHMVSSGGAPPSVTAGVAIQLLQGADDSAFGPIRALFHDAMAEHGMAALSLAATFYDEARLGWSIGEEQDQRTLTAFSKADLPNAADVRAVASSKTPMSRAAKQQQLFDLYDRGVFGPPGSPIANATLLKRLEFGDVAKMAEEQQAYMVQQQRQQMELELMKVRAMGQNAQQVEGQRGENARTLAAETDTRLQEREEASAGRSLEMDVLRDRLIPPPPAPKAGRR